MVIVSTSSAVPVQALLDDQMLRVLFAPSVAAQSTRLEVSASVVHGI
jgi:hypothetical protein